MNRECNKSKKILNENKGIGYPESYSSLQKKPRGYPYAHGVFPGSNRKTPPDGAQKEAI